MEGVYWIFHIALFTLLSFLLWWKDRDSFFWPALIFKLMAGVSLGLLYQYYYASGDTWSFFNDGVRVVEAIRDNPKTIFSFFWDDDMSLANQALQNNQPRSIYLVKWVAAFNFINGSSYWITSLYFSFISFFSSWILFRTLSEHYPQFKKEAALSILFMPSIVFWGSGIIKESLAIAGLFGVTACFVSWYFTQSIRLIHIVAGLFSFWILWNLKYYWAAVWLAVVIPIIMIELIKKRIAWISRNPKWSWMLFLFIAIAVVSIIHPNFYYDRLLNVIVENHDAYLKISNPDDVIQYDRLTASPISVLLNAPWALFSGIFRPFVLEAGTLLQVVASIENLILLVLYAMALVKFKKIVSQLSVLHLALVAYIVLLSIFLALSTPNFGSLSRFKIGFTPFLWFALLSASGVLKRIPLFKGQLKS